MKKDKHYEVYFLCLADMRGHVDKAKPVAVFDDIEKLKTYYKSQLAKEPWTDENASEDWFGHRHTYYKVFKKGSQLEWYNPLPPRNTPDIFEVLIIFELMPQYGQSFGGVMSRQIHNRPDQTCFKKISFNPVYEEIEEVKNGNE